MKKFLALLLAAMMLLGMTSAFAEATDTITVMVPPVTGTYLDDIDTWANDFMAEHPEIKVEVIKTSWDDHNSKLNTMANAGEAPDIAEVSYSAIGTYVELGLGVEIDQYMDAERLADYDQNALDYMSLDGHVYGLPLYITIQALGANKDMLEAAGVDVAKVQTEGWTYDEFMEAIKNGTTENCFGFVFANSGVTAGDFLSIFGVSAGLTNSFTSDLKYAYTSDNMLKLLEAVETMTKSGYMPNYGVEAGQRMVMCQTGNAMIFGKAMPLFENNFKKNNAALEANDGTAVENSQKMDYAFLPVPTMDGCEESCYGTVDGLIAMRNKNTTDEHLKNVLLFMDYICSGERIATCMNELYLDPVCQTGRDALVLEEGRDADNLATAARCIAMVQAPPEGVTTEMTATAKKLMDEQIVPKFQLLLAGETTAKDAYDHICEAAFAAFGEENCITGKLG